MANQRGGEDYTSPPRLQPQDGDEDLSDGAAAPIPSLGAGVGVGGWWWWRVCGGWGGGGGRGELQHPSQCVVRTAWSRIISI